MHPFHAVAGGKAQHLAQAFFATRDRVKPAWRWKVRCHGSTNTG